LQGSLENLKTVVQNGKVGTMKEAIVFILDSNPSMKELYPRQHPPSTTSRLDCAKQVVISMISDLILQSKTNEVSVIVCHTVETQHHLIASGMDVEEEDGDVPFRHLTELTPGIARPSTDLLRRISQLQVSTRDTDGTLQEQGSVCDAILLAADAHHARKKHKFARKIVVLTDAASDFVLQVDPMLHVIDALREMTCSIEVIGFEFTASAVYEEPVAVTSSSDHIHTVPPSDEAGEPRPRKKLKKETTSNETEDVSQKKSNAEDAIVYSTKQDREQLLLSLTEKTGGAVIAVSTLQELLQANCGKRMQNSVKTKFELRIAPGLVIDARFYLLMSKQAFPKMITRAVVVTEPDDDDTRGGAAFWKSEPNSELATLKVQSAQLFVDPDHPDDIVDDEDRTKATQFGSTLIPMSTFDYEGLKPSQLGSARLEILGYMHRSKIRPWYIAGPPSGISGHDSPRACAAIAALAGALHRLDKVAIGTFYKRSTSTKPLLVAVFPYAEESSNGDDLSSSSNIRLVVLQIPFAGETKKVDLDCFDSFLEEDDEETHAIKAKACDDLIQSLLLPEHALSSGAVPSPLLRACNQTKIQRAIDPAADLVLIRSKEDKNNDPMCTPPEIIQQAAPVWKTVERVFQLQDSASTESNDATPRKKQVSGRKVLTYKDFI
jgi:Ku70/Ku80 beta-barrel domain/Ku70/Ku80 N-terminal alpha/beta domain